MDAKDEQVEFWNGPGGERWALHQEQLDRAIGVFGERALEQLAPQAGERVLDVGCGAGTTTQALEAAVGPKGRVVGFDVSRALLELARQRAPESSRIEWLQGDAGRDELPRDFDLCFSRFGVMFFEQPAEAFANLRKSLRPGGHLCFVAWQEQAANPWSQQPLERILPFLAEAPPVRKPHSPGPFGFADPEYIEEQLGAAGFREIEIRDLTCEVPLGSGGAAGALEFCLQVGPAARLTEDLDEGALAGLRASLLEFFEGLQVGQEVRLPGAAWLVTARA